MNPSAIQILPIPLPDGKPAGDGAAALGRPGKSVASGGNDSGKSRPARPGASGEPEFSRIFAEQAADPEKAGKDRQAAPAGESETAQPAPALQHLPSVATAEGEAKGNVDASPVLPVVPAAQADLFRRATPAEPPAAEEQEGIATAVQAGRGVVEASLEMKPDMTGKNFPGPPAFAGMKARSDHAAIIAADEEAAGTGVKAGSPGRPLPEAEMAGIPNNRRAESSPQEVFRPEPPPAAEAKTEAPAETRTPQVRGDIQVQTPPGAAGSPAGAAKAPPVRNQAVPAAPAIPCKETADAEGAETKPVPEDGTAEHRSGATQAPRGTGKDVGPGPLAPKASPVAAGRGATDDPAAGQRRPDRPFGENFTVRPADRGTGATEPVPAVASISTTSGEGRRAEGIPVPPAAPGEPGSRAGQADFKLHTATADTPSRDDASRPGNTAAQRPGSVHAGHGQAAPEGVRFTVPSREAGAGTLRDPAVLAEARDARGVEKPGIDGGRVRIVLSPDHLGTLDMNVTVRKESVEIQMSVQREEALHALRGGAADLRAALSDQGLRMESLSLQSQGRDGRTDGGLPGGYGGFRDGRNTTESDDRRGRTGQRDGNPAPGSLPPSGTARQRGDAGGISVFA